MKLEREGDVYSLSFSAAVAIDVARAFELLACDWHGKHLYASAEKATKLSNVLATVKDDEVLYSEGW